MMIESGVRKASDDDGKKCVEEFFEGGAGGHSMAVRKRLPAFF
jgi:hypothetical protein